MRIKKIIFSLIIFNLFFYQIIFAQNNVYFVFENPQSAITKGQFVAWYKNEELLGSGVID